METVTVSLEGVQGAPLGSPETRTQVSVTATYTSPIVLTSGAIVPNVVSTQPLGSDGTVDFTVHAHDSALVDSGYRGFGVRFTAKVRDVRGEREVGYSRTVKVPAGGPHVLGLLPTAEPVPPEWATVADVVSDFDSRIDSLEAQSPVRQDATTQRLYYAGA